MPLRPFGGGVASMVLCHIHRKGETRFHLCSLERGNENIVVTKLDSRNRIVSKTPLKVKYKGAKMHVLDHKLAKDFLLLQLMREFNLVTGRTSIYGRTSMIRQEIQRTLLQMEQATA